MPVWSMLFTGVYEPKWSVLFLREIVCSLQRLEYFERIKCIISLFPDSSPSNLPTVCLLLSQWTSATEWWNDSYSCDAHSPPVLSNISLCQFSSWFFPPQPNFLCFMSGRSQWLGAHEKEVGSYSFLPCADSATCKPSNAFFL